MSSLLISLSTSTEEFGVTGVDLVDASRGGGGRSEKAGVDIADTKGGHRGRSSISEIKNVTSGKGLKTTRYIAVRYKGRSTITIMLFTFTKSREREKKKKQKIIFHHQPETRIFSVDAPLKDTVYKDMMPLVSFILNLSVYLHCIIF